MSDSDSSTDDLFGLPAKSASARRRAKEARAAEASSSSEDEYADVFRPKRRAAAATAAASSDSVEDSYAPPSRQHVCDECEGTFSEAFFCGECAMTYCASCDTRYHNAGPDLRVHYRAPLHGAVPPALARQVADEEEREQQEALLQQQREAERLEQQAAEREAQRRRDHLLNGGADDEFGGSLRPRGPQDDWQRVSTQAAEEARRMVREAEALNPPPRRPSSAARPRSSIPPAAFSSAMSPLSPSRASPLSPGGSSSARQAWGGTGAHSAAYAAAFDDLAATASRAGGGTVTFAPTPSYSPNSSSTMAATATRASSVGRKVRPASAGSRAQMVVLQSARPGSAALHRADDFASSSALVSAPAAHNGNDLPPRRTAVRSANPTLAGKARFNKNMALKRSHSAVIHQKLQPPGGGLAERQKEGAGAHANPHAHAWSTETATPAQLSLHEKILALKTELAAVEQAKHLAKTAVLKRQKALKEVARIAAHLAKQPHVPQDSSAHGAITASGGAPSKRLSSSSGSSSALTKQVESLRTSNELLRLQIEDLEAKRTQLRAVEVSRSSGARERASLERERGELVQAVSVAKATRELDGFKRAQLLSDLRFSVDESARLLEARQKEAAQAKMAARAMDNQNEQLQHEYQQLQQQLDQWAASQVQ